MATGGQKEVPSNLVTVGNLTLENTNEFPSYISVVICQDMIVVIDYNVRKVQINRLSDGKFLATSHRLESEPRDLCLMNTMEICVIHGDGLIKMMSIDFTDMSGVFTTTRSLRLQRVLDEYRGVVRFKDSLLVSGVKQGTIYWCIVSFDDGHVDTIHQICKGSIGLSSVTTKDNIIYISCNAGLNSPDTGVYGFDILNPSQCKYTYKHQRLQWPTSIVINEDGNIYVCNGSPDCIHQLTASCQLVAIFTREIPRYLRAIFWDHGRLYVICSGNVDITVFQPVYQGKKQEAVKSTEEENQKAPEILESDARKCPVTAETFTQTEQGFLHQDVEQRESAGAEEDQGEEGQDDAPITQEHINHTRLCNALTTVCADALREILVNQIPVPYANIYQAILANEANLTRKLNDDQRDVVFPDTPGTTGTVDQFDISLLYTILRNISSVPVPTTGWGNPPLDQPRDTSLGASVERIRFHRNAVSGHSVDGKIGEAEFKDYWHKIDHVLCDIESVIGVRGYRVQLEKRKNQVITPHEAHQLQSQLQEYQKQVEDAKEKLRIAMEAVQKLLP